MSLFQRLFYISKIYSVSSELERPSISVSVSASFSQRLLVKYPASPLNWRVLFVGNQKQERTEQLVITASMCRAAFEEEMT